MASRNGADRLAEILRAESDATAVEVTGSLAERVEQASKTLTALWIREFGTTDAMPSLGEVGAFTQSARGTIAAALDPAVLDRDALADAWFRAYRHGVEHGEATSPTPADGAALSWPEAPAFDLATPVHEQSQRALFDLANANVAGDGFAAVVRAQGDARQAVTRVDATVVSEVVAAATTGTVDVARQVGAQLVWIAERDGCLHCLAYSGITTEGVFPPGLTFGDEPLRPHGVLHGPPLHPHCRCVIELWDPSDTAYIDGLRREARRSVLRGDAASSEASKLRAADRLLKAGSGLPKSVESKARKAVKAGKFADRPDPPPPARRPPPDPEPVVPTPTPTDPAALSDDDLDEAMQTAIAAEDYELLETLSQEADRRDEARQPAPEPVAPLSDEEFDDAWGVEPDGLADEAVDPEDERRFAEMEDLLAQGVDEATAYAQVFGVSEDRVLRDEAIRQLRASGYAGAGFDALARAAFRDHIAEAVNAADDVTNGYMLNPAGKRAGIDPVSLFTGPLTRAAKYASDELKDWFEENGRVTFDEFAESLLGRNARALGSGRGIKR